MAETEETLPRATVQKIIKEILSDESNDPSTKDFSCAKETVDLLGVACLQFIRILSDTANEKCEEDKKKTIAPEHIMAALKDLGWEDYVPELNETWQEDRAREKQLREKQQKSKDANSKLSEEDMLAAQEKLFAASKARFDASR